MASAVKYPIQSCCEAARGVALEHNYKEALHAASGLDVSRRRAPSIHGQRLTLRVYAPYEWSLAVLSRASSALQFKPELKRRLTPGAVQLLS